MDVDWQHRAPLISARWHRGNVPFGVWDSTEPWHRVLFQPRGFAPDHAAARAWCGWLVARGWADQVAAPTSEAPVAVWTALPEPYAQTLSEVGISRGCDVVVTPWPTDAETGRARPDEEWRRSHLSGHREWFAADRAEIVARQGARRLLRMYLYQRTVAGPSEVWVPLVASTIVRGIARGHYQHTCRELVDLRRRWVEDTAVYSVAELHEGVVGLIRSTTPVPLREAVLAVVAQRIADTASGEPVVTVLPRGLADMLALVHAEAALTSWMIGSPAEVVDELGVEPLLDVALLSCHLRDEWRNAVSARLGWTAMADTSEGAEGEPRPITYAEVIEELRLLAPTAKTASAAWPGGYLLRADSRFLAVGGECAWDSEDAARAAARVQQDSSVEVVWSAFSPEGANSFPLDRRYWRSPPDPRTIEGLPPRPIYLVQP